MITVSNYNAGGAYQSGGVSGVTSIQQGPGIAIQNPNGPTVTIANAGVISLEDGTDIAVVDNLDGSWTINSTPNSPWVLSNSTNENDLILNSSASAGQYNPIVTAGSQCIVASGTSGTETLILTTQNSLRGGFAVGPNGVKMGASSSNHFIQLANDEHMTIQSNDAGGEIAISAPTLHLISTTTSHTGSFDFQGDVPIISATMPGTSDNTTKIATTAWVQALLPAQIPNYLKTVTQRYFSTGAVANVIMPANVYAVDLLVIAAGGNAGSNVVSGGSTYYGGSGGGGETATIQKMLVTQNQKFQLVYNATTTAVNFTFYNTGTTYDQICTVSRGGTGGNATVTPANGAAGIGGTGSAVDTQYGTWSSRAGKVGVAGQTNIQPTSAGSPATRPWVAQGDGCGALPDGSTVAGPAALYITYYLL